MKNVEPWRQTCQVLSDVIEEYAAEIPPHVLSYLRVSNWRDLAEDSLMAKAYARADLKHVTLSMPDSPLRRRFVTMLEQLIREVS